MAGSERPKAAGQLIVTIYFTNRRKRLMLTALGRFATDKRQHDQSSIYVGIGQQQAKSNLM